MLISLAGHSADIYVATNGSDKNNGSKEQPLASIHMAIRMARELRRLNDPSVNDGIHIIIREGTYYLTETLRIGPDDSGTPSSPTIIQAANGEKVIISGGQSITNWKKLNQPLSALSANARQNIWVADVPLLGGKPREFRQLWVNDQKAIRARDKNADSMYRIIRWNKEDGSCWIPNPSMNVFNTTGVEMFIQQWWAIAILRIKSMVKQGDSTRITFHEPESRIQNEHPWPAPWHSKETGNSAYFLSNALAFLDQPGEWYLDIATRKLYYWPTKDQNLGRDKAIVPVLETLLNMEGTADRPVSYFYFQGITFSHTGWLRPSQQGHVPHQAGMYMLDAYKLKVTGTPDKKSLENQAWIGRPAAALRVVYSLYTGFEGCNFQHLASTGLDLYKGTQHHRVQGSLFNDIGGTGILAGVFSDEAVETHIPYFPKDEREYCSNIIINDNLVTNVTNEDWGTVGIGAGYIRNSTIEHNEISEVSYTGISLGWGWTKSENLMLNNHVTANKIHHYGKHLYDVAAIYTLSAQKASSITGNYIDSIYKAAYPHLPNHWFYLYTDEGSSYLGIKNNWTPSTKFLQNANGPGNVWENNGPTVADSIKAKAGIRKPGTNILAYRVSQVKQSINKEQPVLIELLFSDGTVPDTTAINNLVRNEKMEMYQWKNHYVLFGYPSDQFTLTEKIRKLNSQLQVKVYDDPFYEFNRTNCGEKITVEPVTNIILTANLVADKNMQQQYLDYHKTQFTQWPELSKGFCNASFQRLLIYKNGRQLMLIISIPKGKTLDELNPKTMEGNPRVNEWNTLMKKYQEGIEGTSKDEVWVFLKKLNQ